MPTRGNADRGKRTAGAKGLMGPRQPRFGNGQTIVVTTPVDALSEGPPETDFPIQGTRVRIPMPPRTAVVGGETITLRNSAWVDVFVDRDGTFHLLGSHALMVVPLVSNHVEIRLRDDA